MNVRTLVPFAAMLAACAASPGDAGEPRLASALLRVPEVYRLDAVEEGAGPGRFAIVLERDAPTPGWTAAVDEVGVDPDRGRIRVDLTESAPSGMVAQVITPLRVEVGIEAVPEGTYVLEVRSRRAADRPFRTVHVSVLSAVRR